MADLGVTLSEIELKLRKLISLKNQLQEENSRLIQRNEDLQLELEILMTENAELKEKIFIGKNFKNFPGVFPKGSFQGDGRRFDSVEKNRSRGINRNRANRCFFFFVNVLGTFGVGQKHVECGLGESRCDDEKNQKHENDIDERRQLDADFVVDFKIVYFGTMHLFISDRG